ncbi:MAG TPA: glycosyltransferase family 2 protein, partial [Mobilitalea sp.]|nr:glycosyltransferase family 2 protein [Mobilitalea sp.]
MKNRPLVSVIVPVYKAENYLSRCIISILDQTYSQLEIILVDDGSPDKCPRICDNFAALDTRIKVI